ncbi:hypothetical protein G6K96_21645 [Agrobacterium vitis]|uniref:hypothetical protein n=1 Tax=Agrobacterium vitis TaxID=373 RepID=UPI0015720BE9|nr:hypothetical protein [Agrobacterium vitis]NTA34339.1 hypothetical protein [Agrobacterium vitis]
MAFDEVVVSKRSGFVASTSKISIGLDKRGSGSALAAITIGADAWMAFGMPSEEAFVLLIGRGPDSGRIRLQRRDSGSVLVSVRKLAGGKKLYQLPLGHRPEFPDRREPAVPVEWTIINDRMFEIALPEHWAQPKEPVAFADNTSGPVPKGAVKAPSGRFRIGLERFEHEAVLAALVDKRGKFVSERALYLILASEASTASAVPAVIKQIREKLPATVWIRFVAGSGYQISGDTNALLEAR